MTKQNQNQNKTSLLEFPCRFPVKAMGKQSDGFEALVTGIVTEHAELWPDEPVSLNLSTAGNYVSVTVTIEARSQEQLDVIYQQLTDSTDVLMAL